VRRPLLGNNRLVAGTSGARPEDLCIHPLDTQNSVRPPCASLARPAYRVAFRCAAAQCSAAPTPHLSRWDLAPPRTASRHCNHLLVARQCRLGFLVYPQLKPAWATAQTPSVRRTLAACNACCQASPAVAVPHAAVQQIENYWSISRSKLWHFRWHMLVLRVELACPHVQLGAGARPPGVTSVGLRLGRAGVRIMRVAIALGFNNTCHWFGLEKPPDSLAQRGSVARSA
jgi:hypothetical protein